VPAFSASAAVTGGFCNISAAVDWRPSAGAEITTIAVTTNALAIDPTILPINSGNTPASQSRHYAL
jgi:hypothetical protein